MQYYMASVYVVISFADFTSLLVDIKPPLLNFNMCHNIGSTIGMFSFHKRIPYCHTFIKASVINLNFQKILKM